MPADIAEDMTREALDRTGTSIISTRLFGKVDFKRVRYLFLPQFAVRQALFVDSKAEKNSSVARLQTDQTSMTVRQMRSGQEIAEPGGLPTVVQHDDGDLLTTTVFVMYNYTEDTSGVRDLQTIDVIGLPNGFLQDHYNPTPVDNIWNAGPNAPTRGEVFRTRINLTKLRGKASWRVQTLPAVGAYGWVE